MRSCSFVKYALNSISKRFIRLDHEQRLNHGGEVFNRGYIPIYHRIESLNTKGRLWCSPRTCHNTHIPPPSQHPWLTSCKGILL
ncbi:hypothetical protein LOK49_LG04G02988 [Camellia lanceoleosa]|uniref:Uncharacterized protein n=1 Tax=Camellia lanceoleosa TaxID=1840588 RepID=A0ACC0HWK5_9ERIC|nr:hypothetical protein LOK49_LG04G02988 [Camellia lanceoleosa]